MKQLLIVFVAYLLLAGPAHGVYEPREWNTDGWKDFVFMDTWNDATWTGGEDETFYTDDQFESIDMGCVVIVEARLTYGWRGGCLCCQHS